MFIVRKSDRKYLRVGKAAEEWGLHPLTIRRWRPDLERQIEQLQGWAKTERLGREMLVLSDIGSGLNAGRKGSQTGVRGSHR